MSAIDSKAVFKYLQNLQARIIESVELVDGKTFLHDGWQRPEGGGGNSCMLEEGNVFERAGIGFSHVLGNKLPPAASVAHPEAAGRPWEAMGVSLVFHPRNPYIPTVHMNVRFFVAKAAEEGEEDIWWFGGGMDLTPYYGLKKIVCIFTVPTKLRWHLLVMSSTHYSKSSVTNTST